MRMYCMRILDRKKTSRTHKHFSVPWRAMDIIRSAVITTHSHFCSSRNEHWGGPLSKLVGEEPAVHCKVPWSWVAGQAKTVAITLHSVRRGHHCQFKWINALEKIQQMNLTYIEFDETRHVGVHCGNWSGQSSSNLKLFLHFEKITGGSVVAELVPVERLGWWVNANGLCCWARWGGGDMEESGKCGHGLQNTCVLLWFGLTTLVLYWNSGYMLPKSHPKLLILPL